MRERYAVIDASAFIMRAGLALRLSFSFQISNHNIELGAAASPLSPLHAFVNKDVATCRNLEKLKHLEEAGAAILQLDITDSQQSIQDTMAKAISIYGKIDALVNNARFISVGTWENLEYVIS